MPVDAQDVTSMLAARTKANQKDIANQAVAIISSIQRDLLATASDAQAMIDAGRHAAVAADYCRSQGEALARLFAKLTARAAVARAAMISEFGWTNEEVNATSRVLTALIESVRLAAIDGSTINGVLSKINATLQNPDGLY